MTGRLIGALHQRAVGSIVGDAGTDVHREGSAVVVAGGLHDLEVGFLAVGQAVGGPAFNVHELPAAGLVRIAGDNVAFLHDHVAHHVAHVAVDDHAVGLTGEGDGLVVEGIPVAGTRRGVKAFGRNNDLAVFDVALTDNDTVVNGAHSAKCGLFNTVVDKADELGDHGSIISRRFHRGTAFDRRDTGQSHSVQTGGEQQSKRQLADGLESTLGHNDSSVLLMFRPGEAGMRRFCARAHGTSPGAQASP